MTIAAAIYNSAVDAGTLLKRMDASEEAATDKVAMHLLGLLMQGARQEEPTVQGLSVATLKPVAATLTWANLRAAVAAAKPDAEWDDLERLHLRRRSRSVVAKATEAALAELAVLEHAHGAAARNIRVVLYGRLRSEMPEVADALKGKFKSGAADELLGALRPALDREAARSEAARAARESEDTREKEKKKEKDSAPPAARGGGGGGRGRKRRGRSRTAGNGAAPTPQ